jgi:hypothetical protein
VCTSQWNEHSYDVGWIIQLRKALDTHPETKSVQIVASDQGGWPICADMQKNETLRAAVAIIGSHYPIQAGNTKHPTPVECQQLNTIDSPDYKPLWTSEVCHCGATGRSTIAYL